MLKKLFPFVCLLMTIHLHAQTGIGTTTPNTSAKLEVASTDKGFLPPRVALTATNAFSPITGTASAAAGLLVYNTATTNNASNNVVPGYYYWNGSLWVQIAGGIVLENKSSGFTLSAADNNKLFLISAAATVLVPSLPIGFSCQFIQTGSGAITLSASGTTLNAANGLNSRTTNSVIGLVMNTATTGYVFGDAIY